MALALLSSFDMNEILRWSPVRFAEETERWEAVEMILIEGASVSDLAVTKRKLQNSERAARIFGELCRRRLVRLLSFALELSPGLVRAELPLNRSPLHEAARSGCPATVRCLVAAGAAINAADDHGMTPLHEAAAHSNDYAVRILLDAGAVFDATDNGGRTALHYASRSGNATCIQLLLAKGASVEAVSADGCTALHEAATSPSAHAVRLLLDAGADKHAKSASGWTALHWSASRGRLYAVLVLLEAGIPVDVKTVDEETPLHLAATLPSRDVWVALVGAGADEGTVDKKGRTPKERAADKSGSIVVGFHTGGTNTYDASPEKSHVLQGAENDSALTSNSNVCDTRNKGTSLLEVSIDDVHVSEEHSAESFSVPLSNLSLNSTTQQTATGSQEDEERRGECMSSVSGQRTYSEGSSLYEEYSELDSTRETADETGSGDETESGEQTESTDETGSDESDSDLYEEDEPECAASISSTNEETDKLLERGSVDELCSVLTKNAVLYYEGPPLFPTLGTIGTSSKYNQRGTMFHPKFRGRGRRARRASRGNATAYSTRPVTSLPRNECDTELSQSPRRGRGGRNSQRGSRKAIFNDSISQQPRRQGDVNYSQPNTVPSRGRSFPSYAREQPSTRGDYRHMEPHTSGGQKHRKTEDSSSLSQQHGGFNTEHKKKRPDSQRGEAHHGSRRGEGHHGSRRGEQRESRDGKRHGEGRSGNNHDRGRGGKSK